jgi:hypothetical protein
VNGTLPEEPIEMVKSIAHWARQEIFPRLTLAHLAAVLLLSASALANVNYGLELGRTSLESAIAAGAALGADLWSAVAFICIAAACARRKVGQATAAILVTVITLTIAVNAGIGFASSTKEALVGRRAAVERSDKLNEAELKRFDSRLAELKAIRKPNWRDRDERRALEAARQKTLAELKAAKTLAPSDPASTNLAAYLATVGISVEPASLRPWQTLVFVLLVVLGGPLTLWLAESSRHKGDKTGAITDQQTVSTDANGENKLPKLPITENDNDPSPKPPSVRPRRVAAITPVENKAVARLRTVGGSIEAKSQSEMATRLGLPRTSYRRVVDRLEAAQVIKTSHGPKGYKLALSA